MTKTKFPRTVEAALIETSSKFKLAEALAIEIPPSKGGRGKSDVTDALEDARQAIIDAGGEPRATETLARYRKTARWVAGVVDETRVDSHPSFAWVPGVSYSAHEHALHSGVSLADFTANPKTVRETRSENGKASPDSPSTIVRGWTPEQKAEVAKTLVSESAKSPEVAAALADAVSDDSKLMTKVAVAAEDKVEKKARAARTSSGMEGGAAGAMNAVVVMGEIEKATYLLDKYLPEFTAMVRDGRIPAEDGYRVTDYVREQLVLAIGLIDSLPARTGS